MSGWLLALAVIGSALLLGAWLLLLAAEHHLEAGLPALVDVQTRLERGAPPAPFDRLIPEGSKKRIPSLHTKRADLDLALWHDPALGRGPSFTLVVCTHPPERAYADSTMLLAARDAASVDARIGTQVEELIKRLYLEGRPLEMGSVWQGFQLFSTNPGAVQLRLPDDLPRTGADAAYDDLRRVLMLYRYTICFYQRAREPERLRAMLTHAADLAGALNRALGPGPSPFEARVPVDPSY